MSGTDQPTPEPRMTPSPRDRLHADRLLARCNLRIGEDGALLTDDPAALADLARLNERVAARRRAEFERTGRVR